MTQQLEEPQGFDLTRRPWIRVIDEDGREQILSVRDVFARRRRILRIAGESSQQDAAILRLLLVVYWRAHHGDHRLSSFDAERREDWWIAQFEGHEDTSSQEQIDAYLDSVSDRWDLVHPSHPFMQVADLRTAKGELSPVTKLVQDSESPYFCMRAAQGRESLGLPEAARWLVHLQAWNYSGIKSGAVGDPRVKGGRGYPIGTGWSGRAGTVVLHGRNLAETLALNTVPAAVFGEHASQDLPAWEREPQTAAPRGVERAAGPCDLLTWQIRRVRLHLEGDRITGVLVCNGDRIESQNEFSDPMTAYRYSEPQSKKAGADVWMPRAHQPSRTLWRGIEPLLARDDRHRKTVRPPQTIDNLATMSEVLSDGDPLVTIQLVGAVFGTQDAVVVATIDEALPLHLSVLLQDGQRVAPLLISVADATMQVAIAMGQFAGRLHQAAGGDYLFQADATESLLERLNEPFREWLAGVTAEAGLSELRENWFRTVERLVRDHARALVSGVSATAIIGRVGDDGKLVSVATAQSRLEWAIREHFGRRSAASAQAQNRERNSDHD